MADALPSGLPQLAYSALTPASDLLMVYQASSGLLKKMAVIDLLANFHSSQSGWLNVKDPKYGALGDGSHDDAPAINAAILDAIPNRKVVYLPPGVYKIGSPICVDGTSGGGGSLFSGCTLMGSGRAYFADIPANAPNYGAQTLIVPTYKDKPAIMMNAARGVIIRDLSIVGLNLVHAADSEPTDVKADYVDSTCRDNRYTPYCGIGMDVLNNYHLSGADLYTGYSPIFGGSNVSGSDVFHGTIDAVISNVSIRGFVVGVAHTTSGATGNGDTIVYDRIDVRQCDTAFAFGQDQTRGVCIHNSVVNDCRVFVECLAYGKGDGTPPFISNIIAGQIYRMFSTEDGYGALVVDQLYVESVKTLGNHGSGYGGANYSCTFRGLHASFRSPAGGWSKMPPPIIFESYGPTTLIGCALEFDYGAYAHNIVGSGATRIIYDGCMLRGIADSTSTPPVPSGLPVLSASPQFSAGLVDIRELKVMPRSDTPYSLTDAGSRLWSFPNRVNGNPSMRSLCAISPTPGEFLYQPGSASTGGVNPGGATVDVGGCSAFTLGSTTLTFTCTNAAQIMPGDVLFWTMKKQGLSAAAQYVAAFVVPAGGVSGTSVTANLLWDPAQYDTVANNGAALGTGSYPTTMRIAVREWAPGVALVGDTTNGSPTVANVSPTTIIKLYDWIAGAGIPANTRVTAISGSTITLSKNATATATGVSLYFGKLRQL